ncbi:hypothetical protein GOODEAATRI_019920 [Goodea atripinnis]|uniref:Uncharacterized protein n=1 Tax=Goodea atripinnis TaxID=208336 RepID=A0ABV0P6C1_9TELE
MSQTCQGHLYVKLNDSTAGLGTIKEHFAFPVPFFLISHCLILLHFHHLITIVCPAVEVIHVQMFHDRNHCRPKITQMSVSHLPKKHFEDTQDFYTFPPQV